MAGCAFGMLCTSVDGAVWWGERGWWCFAESYGTYDANTSNFSKKGMVLDSQQTVGRSIYEYEITSLGVAG